jgi:AIR synthase-related protein
MVYVSVVYSMGGRPLAVVDALWSRDHAHAQPLLEGLRTAADIYRTPVVGGHSNTRTNREQFAVAVLGRTERLLTSFDAQPGDALLVAVDLRGRYRNPFPHWDASSGSDPERLRADLEILPRLAEDGLCRAAKDISQAGVIGTALMLLEASAVGAVIDVPAIPAPSSAAAERWLLSTFPSYGFVLAVPDHSVTTVCSRFRARDIACAVIGHCDDSRVVRLRAGNEQRAIWNFHEDTLVGCAHA